MKMNKIILLLIVLAISTTFVLAHDSHDPHDLQEQAEAIINAEIPCDSLTDDQLELLGEYAMEDMHPGEAHIAMDEIMGAQGPEALKQAHINMGLAFYCGDLPTMMGSNMGMMGRTNLVDGDFGMNNMMGYNQNNLFWIVTSQILLLAILFGVFILIYFLLRKKSSK